MAQRTCKEADCGAPLVARGWCRSHYNADWFLRHKERLAPTRAAYRAANRVADREYQRAWYSANSARKNAVALAWREANREAIAERDRQWRAANPDKVLEYAAKRRAKVRDAWDEYVDRDLVWERDGGVCHLCGEPADPSRWDLDHVIPLTPRDGREPGRHNYENVAVTHPSCNYRKCNREN